MIRDSYSLFMISLIAIPCGVRAQPVDPGVPELPDPQPRGAGPPEAAGAPPAPASNEPPRITHQTVPVYPDVPAAEAKSVTVTVHVDIDASGAPANPRVISPPNPPFDDLATTNVLEWTFEPARRDGLPIAGELDVTVRFTPSAPPPGANSEVIEIRERFRPAPPPRAVSDFVIDKHLLAAAPHKTAGDLLSTAPGVHVARVEGEAVAHEIFLRGFDAEHGQDIAISAGGIPVNLPSHLHGQGYADLGFLIPEVIQEVRVTEGVYAPRQGDFAVAGSVDLSLGVADRGNRVAYSRGSYGTQRVLGVWAPPGESTETFAAFEARSSDGYGDNRGYRTGSGIAQLAFEGPGSTWWRLHAAIHGARGNLAGVLRLDDVRAGRVGYYDSYPTPTANAQSALGTRAQLALTVEKTREQGGRSELTLWLLGAGFHLRENFTGFLDRSQINPSFVGRGDLIEQVNDDKALGISALHRGPYVKRTAWLAYQLEAGLQARSDVVEQSQNLLQAPENQIWDRRVDATIIGSDLGAYLDVEAQLGSRTQLRGGVRGDVLYYDVNDRLGNFIPSFRQQTHFIGFRRTALGAAWGPRGSAEVKLFPSLSIEAAYGEGYRSPQARQLDEGENAPFAKVRSYEIGADFHLDPGREWQRLVVRAAAFRTDLSTDLAFDPEQGRLERIGPTTREGAVVHTILRPTRQTLVSASLTYVHATLDSPPVATAGDPNPPYKPGQSLPYVPPLVMRVDATHLQRLSTIASAPVEGRIGVGLTGLSRRPLPYGAFADPLYLLDAYVHLRWRGFELGADAFNLLDRRQASAEFEFVSDWATRPVPSMIPARHIVAGAPLTVLVTVGAEL